MANLEHEILRLERELLAGNYRPGRYTEIEVFDPKHRVVSAAPFRDRVVHHALCAVVEPIFANGFIGHSFANQLGKGTHRAVGVFERYRNRFSHVLRCDIYRYFPAIDHDVLKKAFRRRIGCEGTLDLLDNIVDGSNAQEAVNIYFSGDDLFAPFARRRGLPIGNLTSQFFANLYLDPLDHFATECLGAPYLRYVDDFALFADDPAVLDDWRKRLAGFLDKRRLLMHPRKTFIAPTAEPAQFLGFVLQINGSRHLPEDNVKRFRNRLRGLRDRRRAGRATQSEVNCRVEAWIAHAAHADTFRLRQAIFADGWFDPLPKPGKSLKPARSARRFLEQQSTEPPFGQPQQEHHNQPQQQQRVPRRQHTPAPEPARSRSIRASHEGAFRIFHDDEAGLLDRRL